MERAEKIQKLCLKMNVTEVEADAALRACGDDILDAALYLEALGRVRMPSGGFYAETPTDGRADAQAPVRRASESFGEVIRKFFRWCLHVIRKGMDNYLEVRKDGETKFRLPITIAVIAALVCFPVTVALLIIGLFCDFQYHFAGPDISEKFVGNTAAAGCSNVARDIKASFSNNGNNGGNGGFGCNGGNGGNGGCGAPNEAEVPINDDFNNNNDGGSVLP